MKIAPILRTVIKSQRICTRVDCDVVLKKTQKKFCSHICRNIVNSPGNRGGAPSKYQSEFATTKFEEYIALCKKGNEPTLIPTNSSYIVIHNAKLPSKEDYALFLEVSPETLRNWSEQHYDFAVVMDKLHSIQKIFLINHGLSGRYHSQMAKLLLGINHGMIERKEVETTHRLLGVIKHFYQRVDELEKEKYGTGRLSS